MAKHNNKTRGASRALSQEQIRTAFRVNLVQELAKLISQLISAGKWLGIAYFGYLSIKALSGHATYAHIFVAIFTQQPTKDIVFIGVALISTAWALVERWLRIHISDGGTHQRGLSS